jgi:hypothetical protein
MNITELNLRPELDKNIKLKEAYIQFEKLLIELRKRDLPEGLASSINHDIDSLNSIPNFGDETGKTIRKLQSGIIKLLEKEIKVVPKNHYRNQWLALGMATFGIPFGVALGMSLGNMALLGIGLPIGLAVGIAVGSGMDKKAFEEGRQLDVEIKN